MPLGYHGRILHVDLNSGDLTTEQPGEAFYRKYLGGSALGSHVVSRMERSPEAIEFFRRWFPFLPIQ